jgi:predicted Rossmann-fold nucleotide-binding protein
MNKMTREPPVSRQAICVFCGSSHGADPIFTQAAQQFGTALAARVSTSFSGAAASA